MAIPADSRSASLTGLGVVVSWDKSYLADEFKRAIAKRTRLVSFPCVAGEVCYVVHMKDLKRS